MKILKIAALVLLVILVVGIAVIVSRFDAASVKAEAVRVVAEKTGRNLKIDGELALSFWPNVGLRVGQVTLSEPQRSERFAAVDSARISVAVLPLISGKVVVDRIEVNGLKATLIKHRDGSLNIADLMGGHPAEQQSAPEPSPAGGPGGGVGLDIAGVDLNNAELVWQDEKAGKTSRISGLNLHTGRLLADTGAKTYAVSDLKLTVKGATGDDSFDLQVDAPKLAIAPGHSSGDAVKVAAELNGKGRKVNLKLALSGVDGQANVIKVGQLALDLDAGFGDASLKGRLASPLLADIEKQTVALEKIDGQFDFSQPQALTKALKLALSGALQADLAQQSAAGHLKVQAGESNLALKMAVSRFSPLAMNFDLDLDKLNVDQYLPAKQANSGQEGSTKGATDGGKGAGKPAGEPLDFSALNGLDVIGAIRVGHLQAHKLKLSQLKLPLRVADGRLSASPISAGFYEGNLNGALSLDARGNAVALRQNLSGINLGTLLTDLADTDLLEGRGDVALDINTRGQRVDEMKKRLAGSARIALGKGAIKGVDLEQTLSDVKRLFGKQKDQTTSTAASGKTEFSELTATFAIANGVAHNDDLLGKSALLRLQGKGDIDIGNNRLDYLLKTSAVNTGNSQNSKGLDQLRGIAVPVRLRGSLDHPAWSVDAESLAGEVAKAGAQEVLQKAGKKLEEQLLKGLFK